MKNLAIENVLKSVTIHCEDLMYVFATFYEMFWDCSFDRHINGNLQEWDNFQKKHLDILNKLGQILPVDCRVNRQRKIRQRYIGYNEEFQNKTISQMLDEAYKSELELLKDVNAVKNCNLKTSFNIQLTLFSASFANSFCIKELDENASK